MAQDRLFLLQSDFEDEGRRWFCAPCATVEGFLSWFPQVRAALDVTYVEFPRPRGPVAALLGENHPGCPVLVLADGAPDTPEAQTVDGRRFIDDAKAITRYLAERHGVPAPHP